jgi:hypothetical protein
LNYSKRNRIGETVETKISAFPILEPLSRATSTSLKELDFYDTDFLEIDVKSEVKENGQVKNHFIVESVCLKKCPTNVLPSVDEAVNPTYVETPEGSYYKDDRYYHYPSRNATSVWVRRIPERKEIGYGKWRLAGTDFTALIIHHVWPHHKLIFKSEDAILLYTVLLKRFLVQTKSALRTGEWFLTKQAPEMPKDYISHPELPLSDYQQVALLNSLENPNYSLFMEQRTGKTPIVINRVCLEGARKRAGVLSGSEKGMYRALIIVPQQVRINWSREFARFATVPGKTSILRGGKVNRVRALIDGIRSEDDCAWSACIISLDTVESTWDAIQRVKWDLVVIDESHRIKNPKTNRFKSLIKIDDIRARAKMILTGTPVTGPIWDLWGQFEWLGEGLSGFSTFENFRSFHGCWKNSPDGSGVRVLSGYKNIPLIQERLSRLAFILKRSDTGLALPEKVYDLYEVNMTPKQAKLYKAMATKLVIEIDEMMAVAEAEGKKVTVEHILTKLIRLAQICSGFVKTDDEVDLTLETTKSGEIHQIDERNPKIEDLIKLLREDWDNDPNSKIIVWATFIEDIRAISARLAQEDINHVGYHKSIHPDYRVKDAQVAEDVLNKNRECKVLVANPASAGVGQGFYGFDIEKYEEYETCVDHAIYFSCNWSFVDRSQSEDRPINRHAKSNLRITDLIIPDTIDQEIRDRVNDKKRTALTIQDVKQILDNVVRGYK